MASGDLESSGCGVAMRGDSARGLQWGTTNTSLGLNLMFDLTNVTVLSGLMIMRKGMRTKFA